MTLGKEDGFICGIYKCVGSLWEMVNFVICYIYLFSAVTEQ